MRRTTFVFIAIFVLGVLSGIAQEKKLTRADLPPAVQKSADEQSKGATVLGYSTEMDEGRRLYEVAMKVNGRGRDVNLTADGTVVEVEEEVTLESLPAAVRQGLLAKAGQGKLVKIESLTKRGKLVAYEAQVNTAGKRGEIQVGPDGKPLSKPE